MAAVRQVVAFTDKEIRDALIEKAKVAVNGKEGGPNIQGSTSVVIEEAEEKDGYTAEVTFERVGGK